MVYKVSVHNTLRPRLHGNDLGQKQQLSFADAPFIYTKTTKTITKTHKNENTLQSGNFENVFEPTVSISTCKQGKRY